MYMYTRLVSNLNTKNLKSQSSSTLMWEKHLLYAGSGSGVCKTRGDGRTA